jgi:hypothetical protein
VFPQLILFESCLIDALANLFRYLGHPVVPSLYAKASNNPGSSGLLIIKPIGSSSLESSYLSNSSSDATDDKLIVICLPGLFLSLAFGEFSL